MDKVFVIQGLAEKLWATENAMDAAIADASKLLAGIVEGREELQCSHIVVDAPMQKVSESIAKMAAARASLIEAHHAMAETKLRLGVRTKLIGANPSVEEDHRSVASADLREVG
ncbi:MAG: hypothetical protein ACXW3D_03170 [Caulobacteraceae bacterium]